MSDSDRRVPADWGQESQASSWVEAWNSACLWRCPRGERPRDWSLGHAGDKGPHLSMTGESRGCSRAAAPVCGFSRGTTARSVSLSWGTREVGSPCEWRGGARHYSRAMVGESGLETCRRRSLEGFPGLRQETLDRKSTRLNSSHQKISYAVFCLKKK